MDLIKLQYTHVKDTVCSEISSRLNAGSRFSLSLDEYTSLNNRRYLNINVHTNYGTFWNLGMVNINGALPADVAVQAVQNKLDEFNISLEKHIVACVTDGASVMVKFGKLIDCEHQLCFAHGIHLAVCDVLYKKTDTVIVNAEEEDDGDHDDDNYNDTVVIATESTDNGDSAEIDIDISIDPLGGTGITINISVAINKIRKVARMFRKSPLKNGTLQKYVQEDHGKNLKLILDSKTRWNSLLAMLERYLEIRQSVSKALIDCNEENIDLDKEEVTAIQHLVSSLQPVKAGAEKLGNRNSTLLSSEGIFQFVLNELDSQDTAISKMIRQCLIQRINERRNKNLVGFMKYLQSGKKYQKHCTSFAALPSKASLALTGKKMMARLFDQPQDSSSSTSQSEDEQSVPESSLTLSEKLQKALTSAEAENLPSKSSRSQHLSKELDIFEATGERTQNITLLLDALKTIPPTSIESERAFSAAGLFITKLRTRLSDRSVDTLCFLRSYYQHSK